MSAAERLMAAIRAYCDANPDDPDVVAFHAAEAAVLEELRDLPPDATKPSTR